MCKGLLFPLSRPLRLIMHPSLLLFLGFSFLFSFFFCFLFDLIKSFPNSRIRKTYVEGAAKKGRNPPPLYWREMLMSDDQHITISLGSMDMLGEGRVDITNVMPDLLYLPTSVAHDAVPNLHILGQKVVPILFRDFALQLRITGRQNEGFLKIFCEWGCCV